MTSIDTFVGVQASARTTFDLGERFPGHVFAKDLGEALFCEYDAILTPELWPALREMARWHGDSHVQLLVLEPDPNEFYRSLYGYLPAVSLPVTADEDAFWTQIGHESALDPLGSIAVSANVVAVSGASGKWGCWGERDPEIAVFRGFLDAPTKAQWCERFGPFLDATETVDTYLRAAFRGQVPATYSAALIEHYGDRGTTGS